MWKNILKYLPQILQLIALISGGAAASDYRLSGVAGAEPGTTVAGAPVSSIGFGTICAAAAVGSVVVSKKTPPGENDDAVDHVAALASLCASNGDASGLKLVSDLAVHLKGKVPYVPH